MRTNPRGDYTLDIILRSRRFVHSRWWQCYWPFRVRPPFFFFLSIGYGLRWPIHPVLLYIYISILVESANRQKKKNRKKKKKPQKRREQHDVIFLSEALLRCTVFVLCRLLFFFLSSAGHFWMTGPSFSSFLSLAIHTHIQCGNPLSNRLI